MFLDSNFIEHYTFNRSPYGFYSSKLTSRELRNTRRGALSTDMSNRVEHQKRNQPAIEKWPFGFVFGVQLGLRQTQALFKTKQNMKTNTFNFFYQVVY